MPKDELALVEPPQALETRKLDPQVLSKANPNRVDLLQARYDVQHNPELQALFRRYREENWALERLVDFLTTALHSTWAEGDPTEAAQYLADEYAQLGQGIHLVSTETGRVQVVLSEADIYTPSPVLREDGSTAQPLDRIRPEVESAIVSWFHEKGRDEKILQTLAERGHQTALLKENGDPRLLVATRGGRAHIVNSFGLLNPKTLLEAAGGTSAAFLRCFTLTEDIPVFSDPLHYCSGKVEARSRMGVQDPTTTNLQHNRPAVMAAALVQGWIRQIAFVVAKEAGNRLASEGLRLDTAKKLPAGLWIAPPDLIRPFRKINPNITVLPVENAPPITIEGRLGFLRVPKEFQAKNFEAFDRWEALTLLDYEMWLDLRVVKSYLILGYEAPVQVL